MHDITFQYIFMIWKYESNSIERENCLSEGTETLKFIALY